MAECNLKECEKQIAQKIELGEEPLTKLEQLLVDTNSSIKSLAELTKQIHTVAENCSKTIEKLSDNLDKNNTQQSEMLKELKAINKNTEKKETPK